MIYKIVEAIPHFNLCITEEMSTDRIATAYEQLSTCYNGIRDFISVLDSISDGTFNLTEATIAGLILSEALDGCFVYRKDEFKAKYLRINEHDYIFLVDMKILFSRIYGEKSTFYAEDGTEYRFLPHTKR